MAIFFYTLTVFAAFGGFWLALYIRHKKQAHEKLICPVGSDCSAVIHSEYSRFLGIPVELLGIFYYALVGISYGVFLVMPALVSPAVLFLVLAASTAALLFSLYLTFIQGAVLRQWCTWCLTSAGLCAVIFGTALAGSEFGFLDLLWRHSAILATLHMVGLAVGLGNATIAGILFFKFLRDFKVSEMEAEVLHVLSQVTWLALALIVVTGFGFYLPPRNAYGLSPGFPMEIIVVSVLIVNGAFLNLWLTPRLVKISFGMRHDHTEGELRRLRRLAFVLGAVSLVSWFTAFLLQI